MFISRNPFNEEVLAAFEEISEQELEKKVAKSDQAYKNWKKLPLSKRKEYFNNLADILERKKGDLGKLITLEMGRPIKDSISEIEKCIEIIKYYLENADSILANKEIKSSEYTAYIKYEPMGAILAIMPWNFPFSQVFRFAVPNLLAGNTALLKHASNVPQCALAIEEVFEEAGFSESVFQNLFISSSRIEKLINDIRIKGITLTGSEKAGSAVASAAGKAIKKTVLELGGSDPFIVLEDADIDKAVKAAVSGRLKNAGQACNGSKRFILMKNIADEFVKKLELEFRNIKLGDPLNESTQLGPLATESGLSELNNQIKESIAKGARVICGGKRLSQKGFFFQPTIILNVKKGMPAYDQELFGPAASIIIVNSVDEAIKVANDTEFGLGATIWTKNVSKAQEIALEIESGSVFINQNFSSKPELPFGGIKKSGYGREFGKYGMREFVNVKSILINK